MSSGGRTGWNGAVSALLRSYVVDLRGWMARIAVGYAVGVMLVTAGVLTVLAAVAVGVVALFHFIEFRLGPELAYAIIGGSLLLLGLILLLAGGAILRRRLPSPPTPLRQAEAAKQAIVRPATMRVAASLDVLQAAKADPMTQMLAGAAAATLFAWIIASRRRVRK